MEKTIIQYQKAFNGLVDKLKANNSVLAVMVFGSVVTGDLWDKSDIDLFVIVNEKVSNIKNIYTEEKGVPVHIKLMSKSKFSQMYDEDLKGGYMHRIFASSRLVFSKDSEITYTYDNGRYYPDLDRERWNMVYLGNLLKSIGVCKKYLCNNGIYTAYSSSIKTAEEYAKLYVNSVGYMISKDAMIMAVNLNDKFKEKVDKLFFDKEEVKNAIEDLIKYVEENIDLNLKNLASILLEYMREKDALLSGEDIKKSVLFNNFDIHIEEILEKLCEKDILKKDTRDYKTSDGKVLFKENVYFA
ncbi:nucleotidyltransferase domain-containing protein [Clostridium sp. MSJ-11]|uniref:Nucleotidyltransferase domain-containing protein n=1 Tax=Clostridium mobile TaxID=2841512 RepID=A0ABS6ELG6_9CLOT|nr:nucleotidyltransferase domain-containing protein [Clostridium mobile]MBU5485516.1 nucleotidyltransferase domain-containing protein [Clostridium mobile]